jgi:hypothetical protein
VVQLFSLQARPKLRTGQIRIFGVAVVVIFRGGEHLVIAEFRP